MMHVAIQRRTIGDRTAKRLAMFLCVAFSLAFPASTLAEDNTDKPSNADVATTAPQRGGPTAAQIAAQWPRFRGPGGLAVARQGNFPTTWDGASGGNILWRTPVALPGKNSAVVWAERLFCTGADKFSRQVYCLDIATGQMLWQRNVEIADSADAEPPRVTEDTGFAAPTGVTDGVRFYAIFANGDLVAFDFAGRQVWARSLGVPANHYGHASSLVMYEHLLIVQFDQGDAFNPSAVLLAFDAATGRQVWKVDRPVGASWSSPIVITTGGKSQLITVADPFVIAYDPATGAELWRCEQMSGEIGPAPIFAGGLVLAAAPYDQLVAIRPDGTGDVTKTHVAWSVFDDVPDITSPLSDGRNLYMLSTGGMLTCVNLDDGALRWRHDLESTFYASPVLAGKKIYLTDTEGVTLVVSAGDRFKQLGRGHLGEPVASSPALLDGRIYVRTDEHVYCIGRQSK
jgi:outer membrane protein assembly factor BamB